MSIKGRVRYFAPLRLLGKITVLIVICCFCLPAQAKYGGGTGEPNDPYLIYTAEQMNEIGLSVNWDDWDKHFLLCADIDLSGFTGNSFNIIGRWTGWDEPNNKPFVGVFDGDDHKISNFTWSSVGPDGIGLFEYVGRDGRIENLSLENVNIDAGNAGNVGGLVGFNEGTIINCYCTGSVSAAVFVGGLVGLNKGTITKCYSTTSVLASAHVGGVVGENSQGTITDSYSTGSVSGDRLVGGLVGYSYRGTITECYSTGGVSGKEFVGGLIGYNDYGAIINCYAKGGVLGNGYSVDVGGLVGKNVFGRITNCYSTGSVEAAPGPIGGLVADNYYGTVTASFWDIESSGQTSSDGGTGKTTAEMQMASTFTDAGWGCGSAWTIDQDIDYPRLFWENMPGELITIPSVLYGGGSGEPNDPYLIYTAEQLNTIGVFYCDWDKHFKLMEDIDLREFTGTSFNIIGTHWTSPFAGVFDGNGHTISNFTYISTDTNYIGLFAYVTGEIKDLGLINPDVDAGNRDCVGSLVGCLSDGTITNCYVEGGSVAGDSGVGGLVGCNSATITNSYSSASVTGTGWSSGGLVGQNDATITNCCSTGDVSGNERVGGLVGKNGSDGTITNSYATGRVTGTYDYVGGLVGRNERGTISNCYSVASVSGDDKVGGLVGYNYRGTISNSYSTGSVSGVNRVGGLLGYNYYGTITNRYSTGIVIGNSNIGGLVGRNNGSVTDSFWDIETSGQDWSDGGTGLPTDQMQTMSTFTDAGWDFVGETFNGIEDIWFIPQGDYPHLWWEGMQVPMKLTPRTLNCRSYGNWVKAHLTLPEGFTVADVDSNRPAVLHSFGFQSLPLYVFVNKNERVQIEAAFERQALCSLAGDWPQMLTVAGFLTDGNIFLGTSTVRIIHPGMKVIEELAWYWLNADCVHPDFCNQIDMNRDSLVNLADYALLMNINVEFVTDE